MRKSGLPIPPYVPPPVREFIEHKRKTENPQYGLTHIGKQAGKSLSGAVSFFKDDTHRALFAFQKVCHQLGRTMDDIAPLLKDGKEELERIIRTACDDDISAFATIAGVSDTYIYDLFAGTSGKKILETYSPYATTLGTTLEELATILGDVRQRDNH